ncbi:MAG TPA: glycosyltransferase N-terminal domain-containing protein [bacterium]
MKRLLLVLYNTIFVPVLYLIFHLLSLTNSKIKRGVQGRKNLIRNIRDRLAKLGNDRPKIWFHVSSYGEFLQVKSVLHELKKNTPDIFIIVSFFSPSGYENVPETNPIDLKCYLPFDSYFRAKQFVSLLSPNAAVIVRHDIWPNFAWRLKRSNIPLFLIDASLPQNLSRFWPILRILNRHLFDLFKAVLVISKNEVENFQKLIRNSQRIITIGDTKYDQVFERSQNLEKIALLLQSPVFKNNKVLVAGSSWQEDEEQIIPAFQQLAQRFSDLVLIIAPHEIDSHRIEQVENRLQNAELTSVRYSLFQAETFNANCLIIDKIGLLANIYYLGAMAFVGGSFHYKIHNVLEPSVYGIPVIFGPKMKNSSEAENLLKHKAAILVNSTQDIVAIISNLLQNPYLAQEYGERAKSIVMENVGSSRKIATFLQGYLTAPSSERLK